MERCDTQWRRYWVVSLSEHLFLIFAKEQSLPSPRSTARPKYQIENTFSLEHNLGDQVLWSLLDQVIQCSVTITVHNWKVLDIVTHLLRSFGTPFRVAEVVVVL